MQAAIAALVAGQLTQNLLITATDEGGNDEKTRVHGFSRQCSGRHAAHRVRAAAVTAKPGAPGLVGPAQGACARTRTAHRRPPSPPLGPARISLHAGRLSGRYRYWPQHCRNGICTGELDVPGLWPDREA